MSNLYYLCVNKQKVNINKQMGKSESFEGWQHENNTANQCDVITVVDVAAGTAHGAFSSATYYT